jgi:hypothetical protein
MINSIAPSDKVGSAQIRPNAMTRNSGLIKISSQVTTRYHLCAVFIFWRLLTRFLGEAERSYCINAKCGLVWQWHLLCDYLNCHACFGVCGDFLWMGRTDHRYSPARHFVLDLSCPCTRRVMMRKQCALSSACDVPWIHPQHTCRNTCLHTCCAVYVTDGAVCSFPSS